MPWIVKLVKEGDLDLGYIYRDGYFPRRFHYKKDAQNLAEEVDRLGGMALIEPYVKPSQPKLPGI